LVFKEVNLSGDDILDRGESAKFENRFVFECAWEVANKVGGIYTVLRTKAPISTEELGDQYCMLGPYNEEQVRLEVEIMPPETAAMKYALDQMQDWGFRCIYGRWLIEGYPKVVLFDIGSAAWKLDTWKHEVLFELSSYKICFSYGRNVTWAFPITIKNQTTALFSDFSLQSFSKP
jgi:glycogen(starch) synthase